MDRTPFEKAMGLEGAELAFYRERKLRHGIGDPPFYICPKCGTPMMGELQGKMCGKCKEAETEAAIKAWKDLELKRQQGQIGQGGLADRVKQANQRKEEIVEAPRSGAECAYPADND